jgi:hypothetical protein
MTPASFHSFDVFSPSDGRTPARRADDERRADLEALDPRPSVEAAARELAAIEADARTSVAAVRAEAGRLAAALAKATTDHLTAVGDLDRLAAALEEAIVAGADVSAAEKKLAEQPAKVERLRHRVEVLRAAADRAAQDADEAEEVAGNKLCWARLPAAEDGVAAAGQALREYDEQAKAGRQPHLRALADATVLANRLRLRCVPYRSIVNGIEQEQYAAGIGPTAAGAAR